MQFAIQGLLGRFIGIDTALGKLPGVAAPDPTGPQYLTPVIGQDYTYIGSKTV